MKIVITDTGIYPGKLTEDDYVLSSRNRIETCTNCHDCWVKTPGRCTQHDHLQNIGYYLSHCDELVIVSRYTYGGVSVFVQRCLERMKPFFVPSFVGTNEEGQYRNRYTNTFKLSLYFYRDDLTEEEKSLGKKSAQLIGERFDCDGVETFFSASAIQVGDMV